MRRPILTALVFAFLLIPAASAAELRAERMPRLRGESFAADLGAAKRGAVAIFNVTPDRIALYVYDAEKGTLDILWSHAAQIARDGDTWQVTIPDRKVTFSMAKDAKGALAFNGKLSNLRHTRRGDVEVSPSVKDATTGQDAQENLSACAYAWAFSGCCDSCYCVHRSLGIWEWVDNLCCGFGC